jgi:type IV pilus assembly protein PilB
MSDLTKITVETGAIRLLTSDQAWHYNVVPVRIVNDKAIFFSENNNDANKISELEIITGKDADIEIIERDSLVELLRKYYPKEVKNISLKNLRDDFLETIIEEAKNSNSSDIHFEAYEDRCRIRIRIDGRLIEKFLLSKDDYKTIINKIKIQANLDIAEKRLPQDGRILFNKKGNDLDIRVSVLPSLHGEKAVLRLLRKETTQLDLDKLGMNEEQLKKYRAGILKAHGIVLISGPTGSGKTTTLYATLKEINSPDRNILTIEDPIEYTLDGINQVQLKENIGLTFASALRTFLRQDPDIIMLGEIRDPETAQMASRAALTGHLVFSTIHTNSSLGIITRLSDMEIPSYIISSTLCLAVAQRLVRLLCNTCKKEISFDPSMIPDKYAYRKTNKLVFEPVGCKTCNYTGYKGRKAIYEILSIDDEVSERIRKGSLDMNYLIENNMIKTLSDSAIDLFFAGKTSLGEIYPILISNIY